MKALTIWQPWASLIIAGAKPYEFRGWRPYPSMIGQQIVIHAASRPMRRAEVHALVTAIERGCQASRETCLIAHRAYALLQPIMDGPRASLPLALPIASGLGTAVLGEPRNGLDVAADFGVDIANDSDRDEHANWGWPLTDIDAWAEPIVMRGAQGFWHWPTPQAAGL